MTFWSHDHVTNIKLCICTSGVLMTTRLGRVATCSGANPTFRVTWTFNYVVTWQMKKTYIYNYTILIATKLGTMKTYIGGVPPINLCDLLILEAGLPLIFSELLALEITKSNDVQIYQFILMRWNQTCFSHGHIISIYMTRLMYNSFSKKMQMSHIDLLKIKRIKKVKESFLKIVKGESKQYQRRWK